jgi:hypothetical protein
MGLPVYEGSSEDGYVLRPADQDSSSALRACELSNERSDCDSTKWPADRVFIGSGVGRRWFHSPPKQEGSGAGLLRSEPLSQVLLGDLTAKTAAFGVILPSSMPEPTP